jgi:malonate-semialdehyde dehydrogenase (acetylating)/methylmalonate-semialdehyde dehydrogenase
VQAAKAAFPAWRNTPVPTRARVMFKLQQLIRENWVRQQPYHPPCPSAKLLQLTHAGPAGALCNVHHLLYVS